MQGSRPEIEELVRANDGFVRALAVNLAPLPGTGDDIAQEVFLEFLAKSDQWDLSTDVRPLLASMTRVVAMRHWRARTAQMGPALRELAEYVRALAEREAPPAYGEEDKRALRRCLDKLPAKGRELVNAHYLRGASSVQLAATLGMTAAAVRRALFRLRAQLRKCLEGSLAEGGADA